MSDDLLRTAVAQEPVRNLRQAACSRLVCVKGCSLRMRGYLAFPRSFVEESVLQHVKDAMEIDWQWPASMGSLAEHIVPNSVACEGQPFSLSRQVVVQTSWSH